ncbi:hypothetical protein MCOR02_004318 [Pyricularia oryzae]|uniref:5'-deoxynucleotidase n=2 Tax=Pyricularia oryzae TaxID=318829 RepID=A0A4V1C4W6_PYROR|nr:hypothetical protein MCOR02_004318 [Pyricularia oryzae]KAI6288917.1 hypothetical protein MCOR34_010800 [Pyricularia oryzae]KAI6459051.1 hypothetical protein MCOR17_007141 [Pyricularia oryzae]KAI6479514.1 hypothetical protein MCOR11_011777 [Pyricularia oryzae]KAI6504923.1 hypothetical protein MCOR10_011718 [Pyricularia oryzae]
MDSDNAANKTAVSDTSAVTITKPGDMWTVEKALLEMPTYELTRTSTTSPLHFFHLLGQLKRTERKGWKRFSINRVESIADHMYRMATMAMFPPRSLRPRLDINKCIKMCLVHDMAESLVGDITPADRVPREEKIRRETLAMNHIVESLGDTISGSDELHTLWCEFEASETLESRFVQDLDKLELLLQMLEYEWDEKSDLSEFAYVYTKITLPEMQCWAEETLSKRRKHLIKKEAPERTVCTREMQDQYYTAK